jgi:hypothetical protein
MASPPTPPPPPEPPKDPERDPEWCYTHRCLSSQCPAH